MKKHQYKIPQNTYVMSFEPFFVEFNLGIINLVHTQNFRKTKWG